MKHFDSIIGFGGLAATIAAATWREEHGIAVLAFVLALMAAGWKLWKHRRELAAPALTTKTTGDDS